MLFARRVRSLVATLLGWAMRVRSTGGDDAAAAQPGSAATGDAAPAADAQPPPAPWGDVPPEDPLPSLLAVGLRSIESRRVPRGWPKGGGRADAPVTLRSPNRPCSHALPAGTR